jgi:hypothetical protein
MINKEERVEGCACFYSYREGKLVIYGLIGLKASKFTQLLRKYHIYKSGYKPHKSNKYYPLYRYNINHVKNGEEYSTYYKYNKYT